MTLDEELDVSGPCVTGHHGEMSELTTWSLEHSACAGEDLSACGSLFPAARRPWTAVDPQSVESVRPGWAGVCGYLRVGGQRPRNVFAASSESLGTGDEALSGNYGADSQRKYHQAFTSFFLQNHSGNDSPSLCSWERGSGQARRDCLDHSES